jgi:hypothetical protein
VQLGYKQTSKAKKQENKSRREPTSKEVTTPNYLINVNYLEYLIEEEGVTFVEELV